MAFFWDLFLVVFDAVTLVKLVDASRGDRKLLFAGIERVAVRACIDVNLFVRRAGFERIAASRTSNGHGVIFRMDSGFHRFLTPSAMNLVFFIVNLLRKTYYIKECL